MNVQLYMYVYLIEIGHVWLDNGLIPLVPLPKSILKDGNYTLQTSSRLTKHVLTCEDSCGVR